MNYYYLAASLTPIEFGDIPEMSFLELVEKYRINFSDASMKQLEVIRLGFDLENIRRALIYGVEHASLDLRGNLTKQELKEALQTGYFPREYIHDFLKKYEDPKAALAHFGELLLAYLTYEANWASGFLKEYLVFERKWRWIVVGFRAKQRKQDVTLEFLSEDQTDPLVSSIIAQKDSPHFDAPYGYEELQEVLLMAKEHPMHQYRYLAEFKFRKLREMVINHPFSLGYLLSYALRVTLLEDLHSLNAARGLEILNSIVKDTA